MSTNQTSLESYLRKKKILSEETEMSSTSKKRVTFNKQYHESYLKYGFVGTGDSHKPNPLRIVCGDQFSNEAMKPSKLLRHLNAKHPEENALRASYLVANRIGKAKNPFTIGEELILPATKDISLELLGEAAVEKIARVPLSADTVTRRIEEIAEDIEGKMKTDFKLADKVAAFKAKLELWGRYVNRAIFDMFQTLARILGETEP
ncbi:SCAN domain-containing protein 3 [Trichonephila clavipes]|nr:SCAN domain-containing protein 3 [Trichonephila clavipes]